MIVGARIAKFLLLFHIFFIHSLAWTQESAGQHDSGGMIVSSPGPSSQDLLSWRLESERNHHLSGFFLILAGLFILAQDAWKRFPAMRYAWPMCFLLSGLFLVVYSDTELWPFGPKPWIEGTITNAEVLQHKIFAVLLLGVGFIELQRVRGRLTAAWTGWVFPLLAMAGSVLLLFHVHHPGTRGPDHMAIMKRVQSEHFGFAMTGFGIGLTKGLSEVRTRWQSTFERLWPILIIVLGALLMCYTEAI
jgi:copper resistance protein D